MNLIFSLEDDKPEVNIDIDEDSVNIEIKGLEEEITNGLDAIENTLNVINTLNTTRAHIKKFGITKEFLHLVNTSNSLGSAIGLTLPHYEDDSEISDVEEVDIPEAEIVVEGLSEAVSKAKDKLLELLKWFKEKWTKFWNWITGSEKQKDAKVEEAGKKMQDYIDKMRTASKSTSFEQDMFELNRKIAIANMKGYNYNDILEKINQGGQAINAIAYISINKDTGEAKASNLNAINQFIAELEYALDENKDLIVNITSNTFLSDKKEATLEELGWDGDKNILPTIELAKQKLKVGTFSFPSIKSLETYIDKAISELQKGKSDLDLKQNNPDIFNRIKKMKDNLAVILSISKETTDCRRIILNHLLTICLKYQYIVSSFFDSEGNFKIKGKTRGEALAEKK